MVSDEDEDSAVPRELLEANIKHLEDVLDKPSSSRKPQAAAAPNQATESNTAASTTGNKVAKKVSRVGKGEK